MAVQDFMKPGYAPRRACKITTVNTTDRIIEAVLKDATTVQVAVFDTPGVFIWPQVGEYWTIHQYNGIWMLDHRTEGYADEQKISDLNPGEGRIDADVIKTISGKNLLAIDNTSVSDGSLLTYTKDGGWAATSLDAATTGDGTSASALLSVDTSKYPVKQNSVLTYKDVSWIPTNDLQLESLVVKKDDTQYVKIESTGDVTVINGIITTQNSITSPTTYVTLDNGAITTSGSITIGGTIGANTTIDASGNGTFDGQLRGNTLVGDTGITATGGNITASSGTITGLNLQAVGSSADIYVRSSNADTSGRVHLSYDGQITAVNNITSKTGVFVNDGSGGNEAKMQIDDGNEGKGIISSSGNITADMGIIAGSGSNKVSLNGANGSISAGGTITSGGVMYPQGGVDSTGNIRTDGAFYEDNNRLIRQSAITVDPSFAGSSIFRGARISNGGTDIYIIYYDYRIDVSNADNGEVRTHTFGDVPSGYFWFANYYGQAPKYVAPPLVPGPATNNVLCGVYQSGNDVIGWVKNDSGADQRDLYGVLKIWAIKI